MSDGQAGSFGAFRISNFRLLFIGTLASFTAFFMSTIVQSVVAFELTGTNTAVGAAVFGQGIGMVLFGPVAGAFADRLPKRGVIGAAQAVSALALGALGWLYAGDGIQLVHLVMSSFVLGAAFAFIGPTRQALVVELVSLDLRGNAMALTNVANTMSRVLGPLVAGVLLSVGELGGALAYGVMALLYLLSASLLLLLPRSIVREGVEETHVFGDMMEGIRYAWDHVRLRHLLIFFISVMLIGFPHVTLITGFLENQLGRSASDLTQMAFFSAIGALVMSVTVARYADSHHATRVYSWLAIGFGLTLMLLSGAPGFETALASMMLVGATSGGFHALNGAVIAKETETLYMGRVMSLTMMAFAGFSLTALPLGLAADRFGERAVLFGMGAAVAVVALMMSGIVARDSLRAVRRRA